MGFSREENRSESIRKYITELKNKYESLKIICDESDCFIRTEEYGRLSKEAKDIIFYLLASAGSFVIRCIFRSSGMKNY